MDLFQSIQKILAEHFDVSPESVTHGTRLQEDLGADSLDFADLMVAFEEAFQLEIKDEEFENIQFVQDIENYFIKNEG